MSRRILSDLATALAASALLAGSALAAPPAKDVLDEDELGDAIETTVGKVFRDNSPAVVRVESDDELGKVAGTGFFADSTGLIYTLSPVVAGGLSITVTHGDRKLPARLLVNDKRSGLALIKIDNDGPTPFLKTGDTKALAPASPLVVIGFPYDHAVTPSFGVLGGFDRQSKGKFFGTTHIRANIPVQRGQGGSPVLNLDGEVVGMVVSSFEEGSGCFVLPIVAAEKIRKDYARFGDVRHGWAGVTVEEIPVAVQGSRMAIDVVDPSGPAARDFRPGDVILKVGDVAVDEPQDAVDASFFLTAGEPVEVVVARGNEVMKIPFTPADHPLDGKNKLQAFGSGGIADPIPTSTP